MQGSLIADKHMHGICTYLYASVQGSPHEAIPASHARLAACRQAHARLADCRQAVAAITHEPRTQEPVSVDLDLCAKSSADASPGICSKEMLIIFIETISPFENGKTVALAISA